MESAHAMPLWQAIFSGLLGLLYVFAGYRTVRFTARVTSALLFMMLGTLGASHVEHWAAVAGIILGAGLLGFLLGNAFYYVTVAIYGAGAGVVVAGVISAAFGGQLGWGSGIAGGLAGAVLAILIERPIGILATSIMGSALATLSLHGILAATGMSQNLHAHPRGFALGYLAMIVGLTLLGCVVQAKTTKNLPPPEAAEKRESAPIG